MQYLSKLSKYIGLLKDSDRFHVLAIVGAPGFAKTVTTRETLHQLGIIYHLAGSYSTPLALFNLMQTVKAGEILVLDDTSGVLSSPLALSILNAASWPGAGADGQRHVKWTSTTERAPVSEFVFQGKMILIANHMPESPPARAFVNRALNYQIKITPEQVPALLLEAAASKKHFDNQRVAKSVAIFLGDLAPQFTPGKISLRTLELGYEFALRHSDDEEWKELLLNALPAADIEKQSPSDVVLRLSLSGRKVKDQIEEFTKETGLGRRRFFYLRERLSLASSVRSQAARSAASRGHLERQ